MLRRKLDSKYGGQMVQQAQRFPGDNKKLARDSTFELLGVGVQRSWHQVCIVNAICPKSNVD